MIYSTKNHKNSTHYKRYQEIFEQAGILEINPKYKNGSDGDGFPMSFRLAKKFRNKTAEKPLVVIHRRPDTEEDQECVTEPANGVKKANHNFAYKRMR